MTVHDLSGGSGVLERIGDVARQALGRYDVAPDASLELINVSENATFRVGDDAILRVHRHGYHSPAAIESELAWLTAVRDQTGIRTPRVLAAVDGSPVVQVDEPHGPPRNCVLFELLPGHEPPAESRVTDFATLGALTAQLHDHARAWQRPPGFTRFAWDYDAAFGEHARWGRWRDGVGVGAAEAEVLGRLDDTLRRRLERFGTGADRFGLIHADLRLSNLLVEPGRPTSVIDFDDCGFGWYLYDLGSALSFIEHEPDVPDMIDSWLTGYRTVRPLDAADEHEAWTFVLFRRLLLVAWIGSHSAADIAGELGAAYTTASCELAERYLSAYA